MSAPALDCAAPGLSEAVLSSAKELLVNRIAAIDPNVYISIMCDFIRHPFIGLFTERIGLARNGGKLRLLGLTVGCIGAIASHPGYAIAAAASPEQILLKDYRPQSIFKIPEARLEKARYPVIDAHSHNYGRTEAEVDRWVVTMDQVGMAKTVILSGNTGSKFDEVLKRYSKHSQRFAVWCGFDYTGFDQPGYGQAAVAELERCRRA